MPVLYHMTPSRNLGAIRTQGLEAQIGARSRDIGETSNAVYLFRTLEGAEDGLGGWFGECFDEDEILSLLAVHLPVEVQDDESSFEFAYQADVPADWITVLSRNVDTLRDFRIFEEEVSGIEAASSEVPEP